MNKTVSVLAFDLSTACTGVAGGIIHLNKDHLIIDQMNSVPIMPPAFDVGSLGYLKTKKKVFTSPRSKTQVNAWVHEGEEFVSAQNAKKRNTEVRRTKNDYLLNHISSNIKRLVDGISPDIVIYERNETFNGILTIELLAKLAGVLIGCCADRKIINYTVDQVRKPYKVPRLLVQMRDEIGVDRVYNMKDKGKEAIRWYLEKEHDTLFQTLDQSDAGLLIDHFANHDPNAINMVREVLNERL